MRLPALLVSAALLVGAAPAPVAPLVQPSVDGPLEEAHSDNMRFVANVRWEDRLRATIDGRTIDSQGGTDVEFATIDGRDYAFAGTYRNGLQVIDITDPESPVLVTTYDCQILQGDTQTFSRVVDGETRWYLTYTADDGYTHKPSKCMLDAGGALGNGTYLIDITDPAAPVAVDFVKIAGGSHNQTVHPSGKWLYNSSSDGSNGVAVIDLRDIDTPVLATTLMLPGHDAHDITFNADGTRAYAASVSHTTIIDTSDPGKPEIVTRIEDDAITLHHQADPVRIGERDFLIINDELLGAGGNEVCPGGGLHVYDITDEANPTKVGAFFSPEVTVAEGARTGLGAGNNRVITCTSHVFRIYEEQQVMTIAWFGAGVRVIDLSGLADTLPVQAGVLGQSVPVGMREVGFFRFRADSDAWAAKAYGFQPDGSFYIYSDDQTRGFDVYHFDAGGAVAADAGQWLTPMEATQRKVDLLNRGFVPVQTPYCQLGLDATA